MWFRWRAPVTVVLVCLCVRAQAQDAPTVHVHFSYDSVLLPRFTPAVVNELSAVLADVCGKSASTGHWTYDVKAVGEPRLEVSVFGRNGSYLLGTTLKHGNITSPLPDHWEAELFSPEYLTAHGLPMNRDWIAPIRSGFARMLPANTKSGKEILTALETFVSLGTSVVMLSPTASNGQPAAVLPLPWNHYQDIATCHFRILFHESTRLVTVHASGTGGPLDFTPDAPHYKAVWVIHELWQVGGTAPTNIALHLDELAHLGGVPSEFYLEPTECSPAGVSIASN